MFKLFRPMAAVLISLLLLSAVMAAPARAEDPPPQLAKADVEAQTPLDPQRHLLRVASISKVPVAVSVLQLVERGELDLDAPITDYVDVELDTRFETPITMRHLLSHTAGFEDSYRDVMLAPGSEVRPLEQAATVDPPVQIYEPGTVPAYSNYGYTLAAYVVQTVSGQPFEQYVRTEVFDRAGMTTAT
ncbi:hypothetical protein GCM10025789_11980 [Tessaracoccus lubricantis]|uniref:Beta-lactamase-related domain-containing protein n=1 Tax=Tessaracoccus lubricantis TaxID=545543 RepID=A0ABP9F8I2_9ACTN